MSRLPRAGRRWLALTAAAVLALAVGAGAGLVLQRRQGGGEAARPATPPVATPTAPTARPSSVPTPVPTPAPTPQETPGAASSEAAGDAGEGKARRRSPGRRADVRRLSAQVAAIRGLQPRRPVRARVLGRRALAAKVRDLGFADFDVDRVEADERVLVTLRLAEPGLDLAELLADLYAEQVKGVYVPEERTLYVGAPTARLSPAARVTAAHEVAHALQDQAFDLVAVREAVEDDSDASLATLALIEGDAVLVQHLWAQRHLSPEERLAAASGGPGDVDDVLARTPAYLRNAVLFPYVRGVAFVQALHAEGGFAAVDRAFANPPTTTEQILHPDKYRAGEGALRVPLRGRPGGGWRASERYEFGEFDLAELLSPLGSPAAEAAAAGWAGGRLRLWTQGQKSAVGLALAFDSRADAEEACEALPRWYAQVADASPAGGGVLRGDGDHVAVRCGGRRVRVGIAPGAGAARRLAGR